MIVLDSVADQTAISKSRILRELLMAYGAGKLNKLGVLPDVAPVKAATAYLEFRAAAGRE